MESIPSVMLYSQALSMLQSLKTDYSNGVIHTVDDVSAALRQALSKYESVIATPLTQYEPIIKFEPPSSNKMNRFWSNLARDIAILENQLDILQATALFTHSLIVTETQKATAQNSSVINQLKTLQLFSSSTSPNLVTFGDNFQSQDFIDNSLADPSTLAMIYNNQLVLGLSGSIVNVNKNAVVTVLPNSNGFAGNNQEVNDPSTSAINPLIGQPQYVFEGTSNNHSDVTVVVDNQPNTWFEYEHYMISDQNRALANNFGFTYSTYDPDTNTTQNTDWAQSPSYGYLALSLQFSLSQPYTINSVSYSPFGLDNNSNNPVVVREILISSNGTDWTVVPPGDVWIGTQVNMQNAAAAANVSIGTTNWNFTATTVQYIRMLIEQYYPITVPVGHVYYTNSISNQRLDGPVPPYPNPLSFYLSYNPPSGTNENTEYFLDKRFAIGISGIDIQQIQYQTISSIISTPYNINGIVDRVSVNADISIPDSFDKTQSWVDFYISPDNGNNWYQISPIKDDTLGVPEEIAFNDPTPTAFHENGVSYFNVSSPVNSLRVKIVLKRPPDQASASPAINSYQLKILLQ